MKKTLIAISVLFVSLAGQAQNHIRASVQKNANPNQIDIHFTPNFTSAATESINFFPVYGGNTS